MYKWVVTVFLTLVALQSFGQDLIVTPQGDSIKCKIVSQADGWVRFQYSENRETVVRELRAVDLESIVVGFYAKNAEKSSDEQPLLDNNITLYNQDFVLPIWCVDIRGGLGHRVFGVGNRFDPEQQEYFRGLKNGFAANVDVGYFFWKNVSLGVLADFYMGPKKVYKTERSDHVMMQYIGPNVTYRKVLEGNRSAIVTGFGIGVQMYKNDGMLNNTKFELSGKSVGWSGSVGFETQIAPHTAITFTATCLVGKNYKLNDGLSKSSSPIPLSKENVEDLSRINLGIGIKFF